VCLSVWDVNISSEPNLFSQTKNRFRRRPKVIISLYKLPQTQTPIQSYLLWFSIFQEGTKMNWIIK